MYSLPLTFEDNYAAKNWNALADNLRALAGTKEFGNGVCGLEF